MSEERKPQTPPPHATPACGVPAPGADEPAADKKQRGGMSRREFARRAAIASAVASWAPVQAVTAAVTPLAPSPGAPQSPSSGAKQPPVQTQPAPQAPNLPKLSPESQAEVEARVQAIVSRYGERFTDEQKNDLRRLCTVVQPPLDHLRAYALENGDGPALYLKPLVEREKKPAAAAKPVKPAAAKKP